MVDVLFLAHGRREFTAASLRTLITNTNWESARLLVYTDGDELPLPADSHWMDRRKYGGPVAIMNAYLAIPGRSDIFIKIDNDTIVPPGWLDAGLRVMEAHPELDLLGVEPAASRKPAPWSPGRAVPRPDMGVVETGYAPCDAIGGIGFLRRSVFQRVQDPMRPHAIYGGFTDWQLRHPEVRKGWITPPLKLFLLDRLPIEPWRSLSAEYLKRGDQRAWTNYALSDAALWDWWTSAAAGDRAPRSSEELHA